MWVKKWVCICVCVYVCSSLQLSTKWPDGYGGEGFLVDVGQFVHDHRCRGENPVRVQKGVEEVDGQETQVGQPLEQSLDAGVADLGDLAGVERLAEANVNIIFMETHIGSDGYTHTHIHIHK